MSNSQMVAARKYRLLEPTSVLRGTYNKNGAKKLLHDLKLLRRDFVEERNAIDNNELYIIDEDATAELMEQREENIKENARKTAEKGKSAAEVIAEAIAGAKSGSEKPAKKAEEPKKVESEFPEGEPNEDWTAKQLKAYCKSNDIAFMSNAGKAKLLTTIKEAQEDED